MENRTITVETIVNKPIDQVWELWTMPKHIMEWNSATEDWYTPFAENDLRTGGTFCFRMAARDGSSQFDFAGVYDEVVVNSKIAYTLGDGRKVMIQFTERDEGVDVKETFESENIYPIEMQKGGWQSILDHFKHYAEMN